MLGCCLIQIQRKSVRGVEDWFVSVVNVMLLLLLYGRPYAAGWKGFVGGQAHWVTVRLRR